MQVKLEKAHDAIIREKEEARLAIEQAPPVIKEVPVVDNTQLELLTDQNNELEGELSELRKRMEEFEENNKKVENESKEFAREAEEAQLKAKELLETIEKMELDFSTLESENEVLRQQALEATENEDMKEEMEILKSKIAILESEKEKLESENELLRNQPPIVIEKIVTPQRIPLQPVENLDNGHQKEEDVQTIKVSPAVPVREEQIVQPSGPVLSTLTKQKSLTDRQQENHDVLIKYLMEEKRFDKERPVAACIVYKVLLQWRSFEAQKTHIFDKIIHTIRTSIEDRENIIDLAYWLSTTSTLLYFMQTTLKASTSQSTQRNRSTATLFGRMAQGIRTTSASRGISSGYSGMVGKQEDQSKLEAKYPALLFKQHLTAYVEKIYGMIRDSLKKEISPFLHLCIQVPRSTKARSLRS